jgi:hypothetical protein
MIVAPRLSHKGKNVARPGPQFHLLWVRLWPSKTDNCILRFTQKSGPARFARPRLTA